MTTTADGAGGEGQADLHGRIFRPDTMQELRAAIEVAFDYRGDVTLELRDGRRIEGYLFNRRADDPHPVVEVFPSHEAGASVIPYADIVAVAFTGADTASGKSWEAWIAKKESQRRAEAERVVAEAKARGHL